jgi:hypothetical protein
MLYIAIFSTGVQEAQEGKSDNTDLLTTVPTLRIST